MAIAGAWGEQRGIFHLHSDKDKIGQALRIQYGTNRPMPITRQNYKKSVVNLIASLSLSVQYVNNNRHQNDPSNFLEHGEGEQNLVTRLFCLFLGQQHHTNTAKGVGCFPHFFVEVKIKTLTRKGARHRCTVVFCTNNNKQHDDG